MGGEGAAEEAHDDERNATVEWGSRWSQRQPSATVGKPSLDSQEGSADLADELSVKLRHHAVHENAGAVVEQELNDARLLNRAVVIREILGTDPTVVEVQEHLLVDDLGRDGVGVVDDLLLVGGGPVDVAPHVLLHGSRGPGLDHGHHEAVGQNVDLHVDAHGVVGRSKVGFGGGAARHDDKHQSVEILVADVVEIDDTGGGLEHLDAVHGAEVLSEVAKQLLRIGGLVVPNDVAVVVVDGGANLELGSVSALVDFLWTESLDCRCWGGLLCWDKRRRGNLPLVAEAEVLVPVLEVAGRGVLITKLYSEDVSERKLAGGRDDKE